MVATLERRQQIREIRIGGGLDIFDLGERLLVEGARLGGDLCPLQVCQRLGALYIHTILPAAADANQRQHSCQNDCNDSFHNDSLLFIFFRYRNRPDTKKTRNTLVKRYHRLYAPIPGTGAEAVIALHKL